MQTDPVAAQRTRPPLTTQISLNDFKDFYWLKEELTKFCLENILSTSGSKLEIAERIELFLVKNQSGVPNPNNNATLPSTTVSKTRKTPLPHKEDRISALNFQSTCRPQFGNARWRKL